MKWLFLLILISCGKHQSPGSLDTRDFDGDQIPNYLESGELAKNVAWVAPHGHVKGVIRFQDDVKKEFSFSNHFDNQKVASTLLVAGEDSIQKQEFFSEWEKIRLDRPDKNINLKYQQYTLHIQFQTSSIRLDEIHLKKGTETVNLGAWSPEIKINLSVDDLKSLISGNAYLHLHKKFYQSSNWKETSDKTIKRKTTRLYYSDGGKAQIMYFSKNLSTNEILSTLKIKAPQRIIEKELFFMSQEESKKKWLLREFNNGDKVLVHASIQEAHAQFLKRFHIQKKSISRNNGHPSKALEYNNKTEGSMYLRIRSLRKVRSFVDTSQSHAYSEGGGGGRDGGGTIKWKCTHYFRNVRAEDIYIPNFGELVQNLKILSNGFRINLHDNYRIEEKMDEVGTYWEVMLDLPSIKLEFLPREAATFTKTGQYNVKCDGKNKSTRNFGSYSTNKEAKFDLQIESFVEKIE